MRWLPFPLSHGHRSGRLWSTKIMYLEQLRGTLVAGGGAKMAVLA